MASGNNVAQIVAFFRSKGVADYLIAGILGNMNVETGGSFNPSDLNSSEGAIGLVQWEGGRRQALDAFAKEHGGSESDLNTQLEFLWHEMNTSESSAWHQVQQASNATQAAAAWDSYYERSSGSTHQDRIAAAQSYANNGLKGGGVTTPAGAAGAGSMPLDGSDAQSSTNLSAQDYKSALGDLGQILTAVPELKKIMQKAIAGDWSTDKFQNAIENSSWYQDHSSSARAAITQRISDPATYQQQLTQTTQSVMATASSQGWSLTQQQAQNIAQTAIVNGQDTSQGSPWLLKQIGNKQNYSGLESVDQLKGGMATTVAQLQQVATSYGLKVNPQLVAQKAQQILEGSATVDQFTEQYKQLAASKFPGLADQIAKGQTVADIADPYVQEMSNLLEVDPTSLSVDTPLIKKALQGTATGQGKSTIPQQTPLWEFENQVRQDPRWQYTDNAKQSVADTLASFGQAWGFSL